MGGGSSKKQEPQKDTSNNNPKQQQPLEDQIRDYEKPPSPQLTNKQLQQVEIQEDELINKEATNKQVAEEQINLTKKRTEEFNKNKQNENLDDSFEKRLDKLIFKDTDLQELERKIEQDDLSPINRSENTELNQKKKDQEKINRAALQLSQKFSKYPIQFIWEPHGSVRLISVSFKYIFSHKLRQLSIVKPYNAYVNSIMTWQKDEQNKIIVFKLKDLDVYDLQSGDITTLDFNAVEFMVDLNGNFIGIKSESDFIKNLKKGIQKMEIEQKKKDNEKDALLNNNFNNADRMINERLQAKNNGNQFQLNAEKIVKDTEKQLSIFWRECVQNWIDVARVENENLVMGNTNLLGQKCLLTNKTQEEAKQKIETFLRGKLEQPDFFKACFQSNKTIKDTLKKWGAFMPEDDLQFLNDDRYVNRNSVFLQRKFAFPILEKYTMTTGIVDEVTSKPYVITTDNCKRIVIENDRDLFVDIDHEMKLMVFIWPDQLANKIQNETLFVEELRKFREQCDQSLKQIIFDLSMLPTFPMEHRPKFKDKYFQI